MESGAVRSLVLLTAGPEPEPGGGKKKKKAKDPPQPPGMPEAHQHATLSLRHCSLFPFTHKEMLDFGAVPKLTKLVESKVAQTRLNAQPLTVEPRRGRLAVTVTDCDWLAATGCQAVVLNLGVDGCGAAEPGRGRLLVTVTVTVTAVLLNLCVDDATIPDMKEAEVPEYIMLMANQHFLEEVAHPPKAEPAAAEPEEDKGKKGKKKK
eukprot:369885-Prorocentrum_minimum.AAC.2